MTNNPIDLTEVIAIVTDTFDFLEDMDKGFPGYKERLKNIGPDLRKIKVLAALELLKEYQIWSKKIMELLPHIPKELDKPNITINY